MSARLWVPVPSGPLARYASGATGLGLTERGYSRWTVAHRLWQLDLLSRWLEGEQLSPGELTPGRVEEFVAERRSAGFSTWLSVKSVSLSLEFPSPAGGVYGPIANNLKAREAPAKQIPKEPSVNGAPPSPNGAPPYPAAPTTEPPRLGLARRSWA
jgi:hypothetical protein